MNIFLDACIIIYLIETEGILGEKAKKLIKTHLIQGDKLMVSRLSSLECRVIPLKQRNDFILQYYMHFFHLPELVIVELTKEVVDIATQLRVDYSIKTPDALQVASAIVGNANRFITGDKSLNKLTKEIEIHIL